MNATEYALCTADGSVEFSNGTFRGQIEATSGSFKGDITATSGVFNGTVNAQGGTFSGTIDMSKVKISNLSDLDIKVSAGDNFNIVEFSESASQQDLLIRVEFFCTGSVSWTSKNLASYGESSSGTLSVSRGEVVFWNKSRSISDTPTTLKISCKETNYILRALTKISYKISGA